MSFGFLAVMHVRRCTVHVIPAQDRFLLAYLLLLSCSSVLFAPIFILRCLFSSIFQIIILKVTQCKFEILFTLLKANVFHLGLNQSANYFLD